MKSNIFNEIKKCKLKNEYRLSSLKGVKNLSRSDLDTIELYAKTIQNTGSYYGLMKPMGNVAEVLEKYELLNEKVHHLSKEFF